MTNRKDKHVLIEKNRVFITNIYKFCAFTQSQVYYRVNLTRNDLQFFVL